MGGYVDCLLWRCMVIFDCDFVHGCVHDGGRGWEDVLIWYRFCQRRKEVYHNG